MPYWIGNQTGYYCQDNIDYHVAWLNCAASHDIGNIDYIGNWNERSWGTANWTIEFRAAMDAAGFHNTKIVVPDGGVSDSMDLVQDLTSIPQLKESVYGSMCSVV